MSEPAPFAYNGKDLSTIGQILDGAVEAARSGEARQFLAAYREHTEHADTNLGYLIGYLGEADRRRMYEAYELVHPVFGGAV